MKSTFLKIRPRVLVAVLVGLLAIFLVGNFRTIEIWWTTQGPPWFGRGNLAAGRSRSTIFGPVDVVSGVHGFVQIGDRRTDVVSRLGEPLVTASDADESWQQISPEDYAAEFFDGICAWVTFDDNERVERIEFDFAAFKSAFGKEQEVLLASGSKSCLCSESSTAASICKTLALSAPAKSDYLALGDYCTFTFEHGHLETLAVHKWW